MVTQIFVIVRILMATQVFFFIVRVVVLRVVVVVFVFFSYCNF